MNLGGFFLAAWLGLGGAQEAMLSGSLSPDGQYDVRVIQEGGQISYGIARSGSSHTLKIVECAYSPMFGDSPDFAWACAKDAEVHWSPDGAFVAIDEGNYRHFGTVILLMKIGKGFEDCRLSEKELAAKTEVFWTRGRPFFRAWDGRDGLVLAYAGEVVGPDGKAGGGFLKCEIKISLRPYLDQPSG